MIVTNKKLTAFIFAALAVSAPVWGQSPEEVSKIEQAMPKQATVKPAQPRKVLVFSQTLGYHHASIPYGEKAFKLMGEKTGAFTADVSSDPAVLEPENLNKYDALILNNTTGDIITTPSVQQGLLEFVKNGKGLVGIHAATDCNYKWKEFGDMIGGYFDEHPWRSNDTVTLKIDQPNHPVAKAFGGKAFTVNDEMYQFKEPYSREHNLVLTSLDTTKTDMNKKGVKRTDGDFGVSWVRQYGKGRVFYCSMGHNSHIYWNETILQHYLDGIQFALGDLEAPADPAAAAAAATPAPATEQAQTSSATNVVPGTPEAIEHPGSTDSNPTSATAVDRASVEAAINDLKGYDFGKQRAFLVTIDEAIRQTAGNDKQREELANALAAAANDESLTYAARELALRRIELIGGGQQVERTEKLLTDSDQKVAEMARIAIGGIPGDRADKALLKALEKSSGTLQQGLILTLGERRVGAAVNQLTTIARSGDTPEARAAMLALGDIGNEDAAKALLDQVRPPEGANDTWFMAMNDAAASLGKGNKQLATRLYERVMQMGEKSPARLAAFKGSALLQDNPEAVALQSLESDDPMLNQVARELLVRGKNAAITPQLLELVKSAAPEKKIAFVEILGARGDKAALDVISGLAENSEGNADLQIAAVRALETLGDQNQAPLLVKVAAEAKGAVAEAAASTLKEMPVPEVDAELLKLVVSAPSPEQQVAAIEAVAARKTPEAVPALLQAASKNDAKVATAAYKAAADLSSDKDLAALLEAHGKAQGERVLREAARAATAAAEKVKKRPDAVAQVLAAVTASPNDDVKASLLGVLGNLGTPAALQAIQQDLGSTNEKIKDAAVRALAAFPDASALDDLMKIAAESPSEVHRVLAVRGVARLLSEPAGRTAAQRMDMLKKALDLAKGTDEKKAIIGAAAEMKIPGVLPVIIPFLDQPEFKQESAAAILKQAPVATQFDSKQAAELLSPLKSKLEQAQWDKLEEVLQPSAAGGGAIRAYQVSPLFKAGSIKDVLGKPFAPESGEGDWPDAVYAAKDEGDDKVGQLELDKYYPDSKNTVVYLRAHVWSPEDRNARLDSGSDDGMKAWVNGKQAFALEKSRSFAWWSDKSPIQLKRGWNTILIKAGNGSGGWTVASRIVDTDGKPMPDLKYSAMPQGE